MALTITPRPKIDSLIKKEKLSFTLDLTAELDEKTVNTYTFKIFDSTGDEVTENFSGGNSIADGIITFGIIAYDIGNYILDFWVTCAEVLPDGITPYEFFVRMSIVIIN